jgi:osmoprotectant transport system permease protein
MSMSLPAVISLSLRDLYRWYANGDHWRGSHGIPHRLEEHVGMSLAVVATALVIGLPIGLLIGHTNRGAVVGVNLANIGRAIPSFAILVVGAQLFRIGAKPAFLALLALAIPPIVTNASVGIGEVDPDVREAAKGMGMNGWQMLRRVELPIAIPLVMAGVRTAGVQVVATATLAAVVAWGGLGRFIIDGIGQQDSGQLVGGALLVVALSLATEVGLGAVQRAVTPAGLRRASALPGAAAVAVRPQEVDTFAPVS